MRRIVMVVIALAAASLAGCGGTAYRAAVTTWANGAPPTSGGGNLHVYANYLAADCSDPDGRTIRIQAASGLQCTIDEDTGASTEETSSAACTCSADPTKCAAWLQAMNVELPTCPPG